MNSDKEIFIKKSEIKKLESKQSQIELNLINYDKEEKNVQLGLYALVQKQITLDFSPFGKNDENYASETYSSIKNEAKQYEIELKKIKQKKFLLEAELNKTVHEIKQKENEIVDLENNMER